MRTRLTQSPPKSGDFLFRLAWQVAGNPRRGNKAGLRRPGTLAASGLDLHLCLLVGDRNLLDDFDSESLESDHPAGMIGEQADTAQIQVRENLRSDPDFALCFAFTFRQGRQAAVAMKGEGRPLAYALDRKSSGRLMQIDKRAAAFAGDGLHGPLDGGMTVAASRSKHVAEHAV